MFKHTLSEFKEDTITSATSDLESELSKGAFQGKNQHYPFVLRPRLACKINLYEGQIILSQNGRDFDFPISMQSEETLLKLFSMMDGTKTLRELQQIFSPNEPEVINTIVHNLDEQGLIDDTAQLRVNSGIDTLLELENLTNNLLNKSADKNPFWKIIKSTSSNFPINSIYGFAIENYHFLSWNCYFESPVLGFQGVTKVRQLMNEFYCQEYGRDKLLLEALNAVGISSEDLMDAMPLPETMAMCNALTYWANFEPIFFFSTLEVLIKETLKHFELYLKVCDRVGLDSCFVEPIKQLIHTKLKGERENLTRRIFQEIPHIDQKTRQRLSGQTYLFIELYENFHRAIWNYYLSAPHLLRRVSAI